MLPVDCGIYMIRCLTGSQAVYVGQAKNCRTRFNHHRHHLRNGSHGNPRLQRAWDKYGEEHFDFVVVDVTSSLQLTDFEQLHYELMNAAGVDLFNASPITECPARGRKFGPHSEEHKAKIAAGVQAHVRSEEHKQNISLSQRGKVIREESKEKMRLAKLGKKLSDEHRKKLSEARRGKPHPVNAEARQRLIERNKTPKSAEWAKRKQEETECQL